MNSKLSRGRGVTPSHARAVADIICSRRGEGVRDRAPRRWLLCPLLAADIRSRSKDRPGFIAGRRIEAGRSRFWPEGHPRHLKAAHPQAYGLRRAAPKGLHRSHGNAARCAVWMMREEAGLNVKMIFGGNTATNICLKPQAAAPPSSSMTRTMGRHLPRQRLAA